MDGLTPRNSEHFVRLLSFLHETLSICHQLDSVPILSGSLAVLLYTRDMTLAVNDIDLACHEQDFGRLTDALSTYGTTCKLKAWHVLQAQKGELKIEFDSIGHWMVGISDRYKEVVVGNSTLRVVALQDLKELYRRGLEAPEPAKRESIIAKYQLLDHWQSINHFMKMCS